MGLCPSRFVLPGPWFTVFLDFGDVWLGDDARGAGKQGSGVIGLAPVGVRGCGREVDLLQIRLSPLVAHAALGGSAEVGGTVVALEDLWGRDAGRIRERPRRRIGLQSRRGCRSTMSRGWTRRTRTWGLGVDCSVGPVLAWVSKSG